MITVVPSDANSFSEQIRALHTQIKFFHPQIMRIAIALYDPDTDELKTFVHSTDNESPLDHYSARLKDVPSLAKLAESGEDRVIDDLETEKNPRSVHARRIRDAGYRSSFTSPFYLEEKLAGFIFVDADTPYYFSTTTRNKLSVYLQLAVMGLFAALTPLKMLKSSVRMARHLSRFRDEETGAHLDRMARYARLIGTGIGKSHSLDDEFIEFTYLFAPLHDIGKIAIPDAILLKPGKLTEKEFNLMKQHVARGVEIVDSMMKSMKLDGIRHVNILRNIVLYHHESYNGTGYLAGLAGEEIPIEARIVSVADVFDALTSERPYKHAWSNQEAFDYMTGEGRHKFDPACVEALIAQVEKIEEIQTLFCDSDFEDSLLLNNHAAELAG
ncbi:MAG: HD domain-containing phosphohydrolase [Sedimenticola sp.]